jgi:hypothetical protein
MMNPPDPVKLLLGSYRAPALRPGERAFCLYRGQEVEITSWTTARIPWPRGHPPGSSGGISLLVDDELARAIRQESATAIKSWWGVSSCLVWKWRKALLVGHNGKGNSRPWWTEDELALLGTLPDDEIVRRTGRTKHSVVTKRCRMGIPNPCDRRRRDGKG